MNRRIATAVAIALGAMTLVSAQQQQQTTKLPTWVKPAGQPPQQPQGQQPVFKSGVDLINLDVAVLDDNRRPIKGLAPVDFTIFENGVPQQVAVFSAVDIPDVEPPKTAWLRDVAPDVRTNEDLRERRLWLIIVDDSMVDFDAFALKRVREVTASVVDKFGPSDLGAVIFTMDNRKSVDFTSDRARLLSTIKTQPMGFKGMGDDFLWFRYSVNSVKHSIEALAAMPDRRRSIVLISGGVPVDLSKAATPSALGLNDDFTPSAAAQNGEMSHLAYLMGEAFKTAARANVSVYTFDVCGLRAMSASMRLQAVPSAPTCVPGLEVDYLRNVAAATGGKAVVDTNDYKPGLDAIFVENSSYYLLGYQSTDSKQDGKFRRIEVQVNRPNVHVRTRNGYIAEKPDVVAKRKAGLAAEPLNAALSGILPKGDIPMSLTAVPFALPGKKEAAVAVMLGVRQPIRETGERTVEKVDLQVLAYNTDGKSFGGTRLKADVTVRAGATGLAEYEVLARLDLKPGRYQLRTATSVGSIGTSGSLYFDVDVPNFSEDAVSLSGLVLTATPSLPIAPKDALKSVIPVVPTTQRAFGPGSHVTAFLRVYQGGKSALVPAPLRIRLRNDEDLIVLDRQQDVAVSSFGVARAADVSIALPLERLKAGPYLLSIESTIGKKTAKREVRLDVIR